MNGKSIAAGVCGMPRFSDLVISLLTTGEPRGLNALEEADEEDVAHARYLISNNPERRRITEEERTDRGSYSIDELIAMVAFGTDAASGYKGRISDLEHRRRALRKDYGSLRLAWKVGKPVPSDGIGDSVREGCFWYLRYCYLVLFPDQAR